MRSDHKKWNRWTVGDTLLSCLHSKRNCSVMVVAEPLKLDQKKRCTNMHLPLALCLICTLLNTLQVSLIPSYFCSLPFHLFRDLFLEFLCVVQLPTWMSDGCFDGHKLRFLSMGNDNPKRLELPLIPYLPYPLMPCRSSLSSSPTSWQLFKF